MIYYFKIYTPSDLPTEYNLFGKCRELFGDGGMHDLQFINGGYTYSKDGYYEFYFHNKEDATVFSLLTGKHCESE